MLKRAPHFWYPPDDGVISNKAKEVCIKWKWANNWLCHYMDRAQHFSLLDSNLARFWRQKFNIRNVLKREYPYAPILRQAAQTWLVIRRSRHTIIGVLSHVSVCIPSNIKRQRLAGWPELTPQYLNHAQEKLYLHATLKGTATLTSMGWEIFQGQCLARLINQRHRLWDILELHIGLLGGANQCQIRYRAILAPNCNQTRYVLVTDNL